MTEPWPLRPDGTPVPACKDGSPNMNFARGHGRGAGLASAARAAADPELRRRRVLRQWETLRETLTPAEKKAWSDRMHQRMTPEQRRARSSKGAAAQKANLTEEQRQEFGNNSYQAGLAPMTAEQLAANGSKGGVVRASQGGGRWGKAGWLGDLWVDSACEMRIAALLILTGRTVMRYEPDLHGTLKYHTGDIERQWIPDLVSVDSRDRQCIIEVKHVPRAPTLGLTIQQALDLAPTTTPHLAEKCAAHPHVYLLNGACPRLVRLLRQVDNAHLPAFTQQEKQT